MKIKLLFAWYDLWMGFFWDKKNRWLYILPIPMFGIILKFTTKAKRLDTKAKKPDIEKLPKFISMNGTAMRLRGDEYWRDAGEWGVEFRIDKKGKLISWYPSNDILKYLHKVELKEITEAEWRKDNGHYVDGIDFNKKPTKEEKGIPY